MKYNTLLALMRRFDGKSMRKRGKPKMQEKSRLALPDAVVPCGTDTLTSD
jgi:hypothetical protein